MAAALLDAASNVHRARGLEILRGPYDLNIRESIGCVVEGFDEPAGALHLGATTLLRRGVRT